jgi:hypothetical protein
MVEERFDRLQAAVDTATQTRFRSLLPRRYEAPGLGKVVNKLRVTYPVLSAAKIDAGMR